MSADRRTPSARPRRVTPGRGSAPGHRRDVRRIRLSPCTGKQRRPSSASTLALMTGPMATPPSTRWRAYASKPSTCALRPYRERWRRWNGPGWRFAAFYIDHQPDGDTPDWLDRFTLNLLDGAIAVLRQATTGRAS